MVLFCFLKLFILFWGWGSHRREARREQQSLVQIELYRKRYLPGRFPCQKGKENPLAIMHRLHYESVASLLVSIPSDGHARLVRLHHVEPTSQEPLAPKPLPSGRLQNNVRH